MDPRHLPPDERLRPLVHFYETLRPVSLAQIEHLYAAGATFKDPFNEVQGHAAIRRIFVHMFEQVDLPRFAVEAAACHGDLAFLQWTMHYRRRGTPEREEVIRGCSALQFDSHGRVASHRDYWDAAEELYAKLPLVGLLMRVLRKRLSASR